MTFKFSFEVNRNERTLKIKEELNKCLSTEGGKILQFIDDTRPSDKKRVALVEIYFDASYQAVMFLARVYALMDKRLNIVGTKSTLKPTHLTSMDKSKLEVYTTNLYHKVNLISRQIDAINEVTYSTGKENKQIVTLGEDYKRFSKEHFALAHFSDAFPNL